MLSKIEAASLFTVSLMLAVAQTLFGLGLLSRTIPYCSFLGRASLWASAGLWIGLLFVGWTKMTNKDNSRSVVFALIMTAAGVIAISSLIIYIPVLAEIAYILNICIWAAAICAACDSIFAF